MSKYSSDAPLVKSEEDLFGRAKYAENIATAITSLDKDSSYVVGLYSKWGYGKTSTINMIKASLEGKVEVIDIEPWNYQSNKELAANLFYELAERFDVSLGKPIRGLKKARRWTSSSWKKIRNKIPSTAISASTKIEDTTLNFGSIAGTILSITSLMSSPREYGILKTKIEKIISKNKKQAIVFIDDIDRLDPDQILSVFKLIKSVANIKGVSYFLAFDEKIVCDAISESLPKKQGGKEYVDKIVQIPIELPLIERESLDGYLDNKINEVLADNYVDIYDYEQDALARLYRGVRDKIDTPRAVIRFINALRFAVPLLKDEANMADLISIELVRITHPELYKITKHSRDLLVGENPDHFIYDDDQKKKELEAAIRAAFHDDEEWLRLLSHLFPSVKNCCFGTSGFVSYGDDENKQLARKQKRIEAFEYFNRYFTYSIGFNDTSDLSFMELLQAPAISEKTMDDLLETNPTRTLQKIRDNLDIVADVEGFCVNLVLAAEKISGNIDRGIMSFSPVESSLFTIDELLQKNNADALKIYKNILLSGRKLSTFAYAIRRVNVRTNSEEEGKRILNEKEFAQYKKTAVSIIKNTIKNKTLPIAKYDTVDCELYEYLQKFEGNTDAINNYMKSMVKTGVQAVDFVSQFLGGWTSLGSSKSFRSDLLDNNSATYMFWFSDKFDASYLYRLISSDKEFEVFKGVKLEDIVHFERHDFEQREANLVGKEQTDEFRKVIAQQFIYSYEQKAH